MGPQLRAARDDAVAAAGGAEEEDEAAAVARAARWAAEEAAGEAEERAAAEASGSFTDEGEEGQGKFSEIRWGRYLEKRRPRRRQLRLARHLLAQGADCLVAAFKHDDPAQAVVGLLPYLREGAAFAVFCEYLEVRGSFNCVGGWHTCVVVIVTLVSYTSDLLLGRTQPLVELQSTLVGMGMLRLQLISTWWREFQVRPPSVISPCFCEGVCIEGSLVFVSLTLPYACNPSSDPPRAVAPEHEHVGRRGLPPHGHQDHSGRGGGGGRVRER